MVRDTWHIMSGSRGAMCHVEYESNMSSNGTHERHVASCHWVEIHVRLIRDKVKSKSTNGRLTCGNERTSPLDPSSPNRFWEKEKEREKKESFVEKECPPSL